MKAVVFHDVGDIHLEDVPDLKIQDATDAIVRMAASAICGTARTASPQARTEGERFVAGDHRGRGWTKVKLEPAAA